MGVLLAEVLMVAFATVILLWPALVVRIFNSQSDLVTIASHFLRIAAVSYLMMGFPNVLMNCISGVGDTVPPMIWSMTTLWLILIPSAYFLPKFGSLGVYGIRWAFVVEMFIQAAGYLICFKSGRWKQKKV